MGRGLLLAGLGGVVFALSLQQAWVGEDAFITMRVIDNLLQGHGARWNVGERVQVFTHPLWAIIVTPVYAVTRQAFLSLVAVGLLCATGAFVLAAWPFRARPVVIGVGVFLPWVLSHSVLRYASSGLENSLTHLLLMLFYVELMRGPDLPVRWGRVALWAGLGALNRMDGALLYAPALGLLLLQERKRVRPGALLLGSLPPLGWLAFSTFYYGSPVPNTALAKLPADIDRGVYIAQGLRYLRDLAVYDPVSCLVQLAGLGATVVHGTWARRGDRHAGWLCAFGAGAVIHAVYVVWIGGDFLSGRFWSAPTVVAIATTAAALCRWMSGQPRLPRTRALVTAVLALSLAHVASLMADRRVPRTIRRYAEARLTITAGLSWRRSELGKYFHLGGRNLRRRARRGGGRVAVLGPVGMAGFAAGPRVVIVDMYGLTDPLLARLPPACPDKLIPGHVVRAIPPGYLKARRTGSLAELQPDLARYYRRLRLITRGSLWSAERLGAIVAMHLGRYDAWLEAFEAQAQQSIDCQHFSPLPPVAQPDA